jgi:hypothetical protein
VSTRNPGTRGPKTRRDAKRRQATSRRAASRSAKPTTRTAAERLVKRLTERQSELQAGERRPRPSHWRYLRAKLHCIEAGHPPTTVNLAKHCGISRMAIWKLLHRWPWLDAWCDELMRAANVHYWGAIERRMALTALQGGGSVAHAEQYRKMREGLSAQRELGEGDPGVPPRASPVTVNILVPRPDWPQLPAPAVAAATPTPADIPTVAVR